MHPYPSVGVCSATAGDQRRGVKLSRSTLWPRCWGPSLVLCALPGLLRSRHGAGWYVSSSLRGDRYGTEVSCLVLVYHNHRWLHPVHGTDILARKCIYIYSLALSPLICLVLQLTPRSCLSARPKGCAKIRTLRKPRSDKFAQSSTTQRDSEQS